RPHGLQPDAPCVACRAAPRRVRARAVQLRLCRIPASRRAAARARSPLARHARQSRGRGLSLAGRSHRLGRPAAALSETGMTTGTGQFVRGLAKSALPRPLLRLGRRVKRYLYGYGWTMPANLGPLPPGASPELELAHRAWQIAGGSEADQRCYYSLQFEN